MQQINIVWKFRIHISTGNRMSAIGKPSDTFAMFESLQRGAYMHFTRARVCMYVLCMYVKKLCA
jgi:hypothetical protein